MDKTMWAGAVKVLENNWQDGFTIPCEGLHPFQWNWDSGFIALGWGRLTWADLRRKEVFILLVFFLLILAFSFALPTLYG